MIKNLFIKAKNNHLFKSSVVFFVGSLVASAFSYFFHMGMGRMLSVSEYGELQSLISIFMIIFLPSTALTLVVTRFSSHNHRPGELYKVKSFFKKFTRDFALVGSFVSLTLVVFYKQIAVFLQLGDPREVIIFSLIFLFLFLLGINRGVLQGFHFFKELSWVSILETLSKFIFGIILVWMGWRIYGAIWAIVIGFLSSYLYSFLPLRRIFSRDDLSAHNENCQKKYYGVDPHPNPPQGEGECVPPPAEGVRGMVDLIECELSKDELKDLTRYAMPVVLSLLGIASLLSFDVILAKHYFAPELAGEYGGISIIGRIIYFATVPLANVLFSISARQHKDGENYQKSFFMSFMFTLSVSGCAVFAYFIFPHLVIQTLLGGKYINAAGYLGWYAVAITMLSLVNLTVNFLLSIKMTKCVYLVLGGVLLQILGIAIWHQNIWQLILILNSVMALILSSLFIYFFSYEKHTWRACLNR